MLDSNLAMVIDLATAPHAPEMPVNPTHAQILNFEAARRVREALQRPPEFVAALHITVGEAPRRVVNGPRLTLEQSTCRDAVRQAARAAL